MYYLRRERGADDVRPPDYSIPAGRRHRKTDNKKRTAETDRAELIELLLGPAPVKPVIFWFVG